MTQDQWLQIRNLEEMPMPVWFEYYLENGGLLKDFNEFVHYFTVLLRSPLVLPGGRVIAINLATATHRIHKYYNKKFEL